MNTYAGLVLELHAFRTTALGGAKWPALRRGHSVLLVRGPDGPQGWSSRCRCMSLLWPEMEPWLSGHGARGLVSILTELRPLLWFESRLGHIKSWLKVYVFLLKFLESNRDTAYIIAPDKILSCHLRLVIYFSDITQGHVRASCVRCEICVQLCSMERLRFSQWVCNFEASWLLFLTSDATV
jgi:hypothetical protein